MPPTRTPEENAFIRQYAAEIAQFLRDQDETPPTTSVEESISALYRSLCFDEPMIDSTTIPNLSIAASSLARQLTATTVSQSPNKTFALSNRLVNGVVYLCQQHRATVPAVPSSSSTSNDTSTLQSNTNAPSPMALAKLAFAILIQVPLECCQDLDNLRTVQRYLGSYNSAPLTTQVNAKATTVVDQQVERLTQALAGDATNLSSSNTPEATRAMDTPTNYAHDLQEEVWAAESDPSDYDYGEGAADPIETCPSTGQQGLDEDWLDPLVLSRADPQLTPEEAKVAIASLLRQASYALFEPLFARSKKEDLELYLGQLTQLLLILLHPSKEGSLLENASNTSKATAESPLQDATLTPLWILRDVALHHTSPTSLSRPTPQQASATTEQLFTTAYMDVLQTLLAVDQAHQSDQQQITSTTDPLCAASIVGLSALSSWCSSSEISIPLTTTAILDAMNDLSHVMERASACGYQANLRHSIVPILEVLSGISFVVDEEGSSGRAPTKRVAPQATIAQTLLSSGLLRHILLLSLDLKDHQDNSSYIQEDMASRVESLPPYACDHAIWGLCVTYPTVIGKYVLRYPGIAKFFRDRYGTGVLSRASVDSKVPSSQQYVQSFLWNAYAYSNLANSTAAPAPRVVWKTNASAASDPPLTAEECEAVAQKAWSQVCKTVKEAVLESATATSNEGRTPRGEAKEAVHILQDWKRLLHYLHQIPTMNSVAKTLLQDHSTELASIREALQIDSQAIDSDFKATQVTDTPADDVDRTSEDDDKKSGMSNAELVVAQTRKLLKQYTLFFQDSARGSSKTD